MLDMNEEEREKFYWLTTRGKFTGNHEAILLLYGWIFRRANCELRPYNRVEYVTTFFPDNRRKDVRLVIKEMLDHLLDTTQGHTIVDEKTPPNLEGLDLASHRVCCALDNISSWCRSRASVDYGSVTPDAGTIGFNVKSKIRITHATSQSDQAMNFATENKRAIPLTFNTFILRSGTKTEVFTICCDCTGRCKPHCNCSYYYQGEIDCSWMCARTNFEGQCALTDTANFEHRLENFKSTSYTLGEAGEEEEDKLILRIPRRTAKADDTLQISQKDDDDDEDDEDDDKENYESNDDQVFSSSDREVDIGYAKEDDENENDSEDDYVDALRVRLVNFDNEEEDFDYDENQFGFLGDVNSNPKSFLDDDDNDYDDAESSDKIDGLLRGMDCDDDDDDENEMEGDF
jgi:hypothetical protein